MSTLADRINEAIEASGLTASAVAKALGCTPEAVSQWRSGRTKNLKGDLLFGLSDLTGYEARWLATGRGPKRKPEADARLKRIEDIYARADEHGRQFILRAAELIAGYEVWDRAGKKAVA